MIRTAIVALLLVTCSTGPVFNDRAYHEEGHDRPCYIEGRLQPGWHQCQWGDAAGKACCPDGMSCGDDDFVARPGICRSW